MAKASTGKNKAAGGKRGALANRASMSYETIDVAVRNAVAIVVLNRPDVHNAFNETLISELTAALRAMDSDPEVRAVVLAGAGESFCAGADLNWMQKMAAFNRAQNLADARSLAAMLATLDTLSKRTIDADLIADTAQRIARVRSSPEGREGIAAFLAKRKAAWVPRGE